jgi:serine/threonine kinase 32
VQVEDGQETWRVTTTSPKAGRERRQDPMGGGMGRLYRDPIHSSDLDQQTRQQQQTRECAPYKITKIIGKGGFAIVYEAYHVREKKIYAIKETNFSRVESQSSELEMALTELEALKAAGSHPFLVKLHSAFREGPCSYLVLDPLLGGDLRYHLRHFQLFRERHVAYFVACIGSALHHLHERGILHRDVKPENVMLGATGVPYLTDFGTAYLEPEGRVPLCSFSSGTLPYLSPESLTVSRRHS